MTETHAYLSCSGASSWVNCAAYPSVASKFPEDDSEEARRGTAAHWLLEQILHTLKNRERPSVDDYRDTDAPNGVIIDQEIIEGVWAAVKEVLAIIGEDDYLWPTFEIELKIRVTRVHATKCWGTADIVIYDYSKRHIYVLDFKFGHVYVEPWENWQLMLYAIGALDCAKCDDLTWTVTLQTLQPRSYGATQATPWNIPASELRPYGNQAASAAELALAENPVATTGNHCRYCPGRHACNAYLGATEKALEVSRLPQLSEPTPINVSAELSLLSRAIDILKARRSALVVQAERYIAAGNDISGYAMKPKQARLKWVKKHEEVVTLGKMLDIDLTKPVELITPTQAINRGIDADLVNRYATREPGGMVLTEFDPLSTRKHFSRN